MPLADGHLGPDDMRRLAALLKLRASAQPPTVEGGVLAAQDRIDAGALARWANAGVSLMVLPVMAREPQVRPMTWPRLEDGRDG